MPGNIILLLVRS